MRRPLLYQPFLIGAYLFRAVMWTIAAMLICAGRLATVVAGQSAFIAGIVLCLVGYGHVGAPLGVVGLVASRVAA
jgi:hypothetical protein